MSTDKAAYLIAVVKALDCLERAENESGPWSQERGLSSSFGIRDEAIN